MAETYDQFLQKHHFDMNPYICPKCGGEASLYRYGQTVDRLKQFCTRERMSITWREVEINLRNRNARKYVDSTKFITPMALAKELNAKLFVVRNGGHLNGSSGWVTLPQCLGALKEMIG